MSTDGFRPAWWLRGPHAQTIGARLLRSPRGVTFRRERIELPDGDFVDLDWASCRGGNGGSDGNGAPLVVVLHGLEGCAQSKYALEAYRALARRKIAAVGLNFRACSGEPNRRARMYHSGETTDLAFVLDVLRSRFPERPLGALGFSLGGNVLLKYLGEMGENPLLAAVAISVPYDLSAGADSIERGFSRVYRQYFIRRLRRKVRAKAALLRAHIDVSRLLAARTLREFDDAGTAPLHGFRDAEDYYRQSSAAQYLHVIRIPALLIHSSDDPFLPAAAMPTVAVRDNPHIEARFSDRGGHVGFVSGPPWAPVFWAEREAARFLAEKLAAMMGDEGQWVQ